MVWLTVWFFNRLLVWFIVWVMVWWTVWLIDCCIMWLIDWLIVWLLMWFVVWLIVWLRHWLFDSLFHELRCFVVDYLIDGWSDWSIDLFFVLHQWSHESWGEETSEAAKTQAKNQASKKTRFRAEFIRQRDPAESVGFPTNFQPWSSLF